MFLSRNLSKNSCHNLGTSMVGMLIANIGLSTGINATIPANMPSGNYYVCTIADSVLAIPEGNESNNTLCTVSTVKITNNSGN